MDTFGFKVPTENHYKAHDGKLKFKRILHYYFFVFPTSACEAKKYPVCNTVN